MSSAADKAKAKTSETTSRLAYGLERIASDLFTLEVTTIVQDDIPAMKMPPASQAMQDLARMYSDKLSAMGPPPAAQPAAMMRSGGKDGFEQMQKHAARMLEEMHAPGMAASADAAMVQRIHDNCRELMALSKDTGAATIVPVDVALAPDELLRLKLIWQMGVERVAMKTVISITGDVITRVRPDALETGGGAVVAIHQAAIKTSVEFWRSLVDVVSNFVQHIGQLFSGSRP